MALVRVLIMKVLPMIWETTMVAAMLGQGPYTGLTPLQFVVDHASRMKKKPR